MLALLRTNQFVGNILLVFYLALVRIPFFLYPQFPTEEFTGGVAWNYLVASNYTAPGWSNVLLACLITLIVALGLNIVEFKHRLTGELNLIPGAMFILFSSFFNVFQVLNPVLLALPFLVYILDALFSLYKEPRPSKKLFNMGFWLGLSCLFYPSLIWLFIFIAVALSIIRALRLKEVFMVLCGWLTLYFLVGVFAFWHDALPYFFSTQFGSVLAWLDWQLDPTYYLPWIPLGAMGLILGWGILSFSSFQIKKSIQVKKSISVLFLNLFFAGLIFFIQSNAGVEHLLLLFPALAYVLSFLLLRSKPAMAEMLHLIMLFLLIAYQFLAGLA